MDVHIMSSHVFEHVFEGETEIMGVQDIFQLRWQDLPAEFYTSFFAAEKDH